MQGLHLIERSVCWEAVLHWSCVSVRFLSTGTNILSSGLAFQGCLHNEEIVCPSREIKRFTVCNDDDDDTLLGKCQRELLSIIKDLGSST